MGAADLHRIVAGLLGVGGDDAEAPDHLGDLGLFERARTGMATPERLTRRTGEEETISRFGLLRSLPEWSISIPAAPRRNAAYRRDGGARRWAPRLQVGQRLVAGWIVGVGKDTMIRPAPPLALET